jgi:putative ABC transport system permease protein
MLKNVIKVSYRNFGKHKFNSFINIAGLTIGLTSAIFIFLYIQDERSFDTQFANYDRIYRANLVGRFQNQDFRIAVTSAPMAAALASDFPEVERSTRVNSFGNPIVRYKENSFIESNFYQADSSFFDLFSWPLIQGNSSNALSRKNAIVISEKMAKKYFGNENPIGKILEIGDSKEKYEVKGIMRNWPANSHLCPDFISSFVSNDYSRDPNWISNNIYTYVKLKENQKGAVLESKFPAMIEKYVGPQMEQFMGGSLKQALANGSKWGYTLIPIADIHLKSDYTVEARPTGSSGSIYIFTIIAILIITIACINFMNLSTAKSSARAKEVALRKILGSQRGKLMIQFIIESLFFSMVSLLLALFLVELLMPLFNSLSGKELYLSFASPISILGLILLGIFVGLLAGSYPAFFLSSFEPLRIFRSELIKAKAKFSLRGVLVVLQLTITIALFISTLVISKQMSFVQNKKLGFDKENVLVIERTGALGRNAGTFKQELRKIPEIKTMSYSSNVPGEVIGMEAYNLEGLGPEGVRAYKNMSADEDLQGALNLEMASGRWFSRDMPSDTNSCIVNEALIRATGIKDPLSSSLLRATGDKHWLKQKIVGVVKDFHNESLHQNISPLVIWFPVNPNLMVIRLNNGNPVEAVAKIKTIWDRILPDQPFTYSFLDNKWMALYKNEQKSKSLFTIFSILSIFIATLGLLGIAVFTAEKRTKEIGIRKVLGANITMIIKIMTREIYVFALIASILSWIIAYYFTKGWLNNFYYRVEVSVWTFILSSALALFIAIITVGSISFFAARSNPVKSIHYE